MATPEEQNLAQFKETYQQVTPGIAGVKHEGGLYGFARRAAEAAERMAGEAAKAVLYTPVTWYGFDGQAQPKDKRNTVTLAVALGWLDSGFTNINTAIAKVLAEVTGIRAAVEALGKQQGIDPVELARLIDKAVSEAADKHLSEIGTYELKKVEDTNE